jgi:molecular chaperone IbpA
MRNLDLSPFFRSSIGFDRLSDLVDSALRSDESASGYPPYNIEKLGEHTYRLTMAVAGFSERDLAVSVQNNMLVVAGRARQDEENIQYLYRGIAGRAFERHFQLADFIKVGKATLEDGMLKIILEREIPEAMKPRRIEIESLSGNKQLKDAKLIEQ